MFVRPSASALNHLLMQNSWALPRLAHFAGKTMRFELALLTVAYTVLPDGTLGAADASTSADAMCDIAPSLLPRLALQDEKAQAEIRTQGDAVLLAEIFFLARNLRWDAAEDLSLITGDIVAERIVQAAQTTRQHLQEAVLNLSQAAAKYWTEKHPVFATPRQLSAFAQQVNAARDNATRLEQRINTLSTESAPACV